MNTGFRVCTERNLPPKEVLEDFKRLPAANMADCMNLLSAPSSEIRGTLGRSGTSGIGFARSGS